MVAHPGRPRAVANRDSLAVYDPAGADRGQLEDVQGSQRGPRVLPRAWRAGRQARRGRRRRLPALRLPRARLSTSSMRARSPSSPRTCMGGRGRLYRRRFAGDARPVRIDATRSWAIRSAGRSSATPTRVVVRPKYGRVRSAGLHADLLRGGDPAGKERAGQTERFARAAGLLIALARRRARAHSSRAEYSPTSRSGRSAPGRRQRRPRRRRRMRSSGGGSTCPSSTAAP